MKTELKENKAILKSDAKGRLVFFQKAITCLGYCDPYNLYISPCFLKETNTTTLYLRFDFQLTVITFCS